MAENSQNGWNEYSRLVLSELQKGHNERRELQNSISANKEELLKRVGDLEISLSDKLSGLSNRITVLETRSILTGAAAGAVISAIIAIIAAII